MSADGKDLGHDLGGDRGRNRVLGVIDHRHRLHVERLLEIRHGDLGENAFVNGVAERPRPIGLGDTGLGGGLRSRDDFHFVGDRKSHFARAAGERACHRQHLVVTGELAQRIGRFGGLGAVVIDHDLELLAGDAARLVDLLLQQIERGGVGAAPFGKWTAAWYDRADSDLIFGPCDRAAGERRCRGEQKAEQSRADVRHSHPPSNDARPRTGSPRSDCTPRERPGNANTDQRT